MDSNSGFDSRRHCMVREDAVGRDGRRVSAVIEDRAFP